LFYRRDGAAYPRIIGREEAYHGRVTPRWVAAVGPVEHAIFDIELEIDRLRQVVEEHFDVRVLGGGLTLGDFEVLV
jgi:hypothetical protein